MLEDIDSYLELVVTEACNLLQLTSTDATAVVTTDSRVNLCARLAYSQITTYLNRDLLYKTHYEEYFEEDTTIALRCTPVKSVTTVRLSDTRYSEVLTDVDAYTLLDPLTDYRLIRNRILQLYNLDKIASVVGSTTQRLNVYVEYIGGSVSSESFPAIHNGLVTQTIANYNRIPALGLTQLEGSKSSGRVLLNLNLVDAGQLLEAVKVAIEPFVYYGSAENLDAN